MEERDIIEQLFNKLPCCQLDAQGVIVSCSARVEKLLGYSVAELQGKHFSLLCKKGYNCETPLASLLDSVADNGEVKFEANCICNNDVEIDTEIALAPIRNKLGELTGFAMMIWDITPHKQRVRSLKESKELFSSTFYQAGVGMVLVRMSDAVFLGGNSKICTMLGYTEEELCARTIMDVTHPEDIQVDLDNTRRMINGELDMFTIEKRLLRKDGSSVWTRLTAASIARDETGQALYGMAVAEDITQIKAAQDALQESEDRFRNLADSAPVLIFMTDTEGKNLYVNKSYLDYTGLGYEDVLSNRWQNIIHPDDRDDYLKLSFEAFHQQKPFHCEARMKRCDGQYGWILASGVPRYTPNGLFLGFIGTAVDITERKTLEESIEQAKLHAERLNHKKSEFLSMMSHELRTPLNSIIGYSRMIENEMAGPLSDEQSRFIRNVVFSGKHLLNIVNDLLDLSKVEAGKMKIAPIQFELAPLIEEVQIMLIDLAHNKGIALLFDIPEDLEIMEADPARFKQILINLIGNAIKFNRPGGEVRVRLYRTDDDKWLMVQVQDTGIGIPKDQLNNIFTKFYQVDTSDSRSYEGTGLGLALTKELIELHGGKIEIESNEGVGSTFTFRIPSSLSKVEKENNYGAESYSSR